MNPAVIMQEIADRLDGIAGLRVFAHPPKTVTAPAAIVSYPQAVAYDQTYGRGMTRVNGLQVWLVVGKATERSARDDLGDYVAEAGPRSVKVALEAAGADSWDDLHVESVEFDVVTIASIDYMAAGFTINLACQGGTS
jgi:hypothetical protein